MKHRFCVECSFFLDVSSTTYHRSQVPGASSTSGVTCRQQTSYLCCLPPGCLATRSSTSFSLNLFCFLSDPAIMARFELDFATVVVWIHLLFWHSVKLSKSAKRGCTTPRTNCTTVLRKNHLSGN